MQGFGQTCYIFNNMRKAFKNELENTYVQ